MSKQDAVVSQLRSDLRRFAIVQRLRMAEGGGTVHVGYACEVCQGAWDKGSPEVHAVTCTAVPLPAAPQAAQGGDGTDVRWAQVNSEPFEYAIQQGHHGDEFVRLLNGQALKRLLAPVHAGPRWRHKKRGSTYVVVGECQVQAEEPLTNYEIAVVYRSEQDGSLWVRRRAEFQDGRFEALSANVSQCAYCGSAHSRCFTLHQANYCTRK